MFKSWRFEVEAAAKAGRDIPQHRRISGPEPEAVQEIRGQDENYQKKLYKEFFKEKVLFRQQFPGPSLGHPILPQLKYAPKK